MLNSAHARSQGYSIIEDLPVEPAVKRKLKRWWHDHRSHPRGKNPGDLWRLATRPFPEAHFAVYPETLCAQPIRAACPGAICSRCGVPKERYRSSRSRRQRGNSGQTWLAGRGKKRSDHAARGCASKQRISCSCKRRFQPGIVFDPFAGSGTTLVAAKRLGRRYMGCDLNPAYVKLATRRLARTPRLLPINQRLKPGGVPQPS